MLSSDSPIDPRFCLQERVTAPLGALYFSARMDCSLLLRYTRMMRLPHDNFLVQLEDATGLPIHIVITFVQGTAAKRGLKALAKRRISRRVSTRPLVHMQAAEGPMRPGAR